MRKFLALLTSIAVVLTVVAVPALAADKAEIFYNTGGKVAGLTAEYLAMDGITNWAPLMTCANTAGSVIGVNKATDESVSSGDAHIWDNGSANRGSAADDREWVSAKSLSLEGIVIYTDCNQRPGGQCISYYDVYVVDTDGNKKVVYSMKELAPQGYYTLHIPLDETIGAVKAVGIDRYTASEAGITSWGDSAGKIVEIRVFGKDAGAEEPAEPDKPEIFGTGEIYFNASGKAAAFTDEYLAMPGITNLAPSMTYAKTAGTISGYGVDKATDGSLSSSSSHMWDNGKATRGSAADDREWVSAKPLSLEGIVIYTDCNQRAGGQCISYYDVYAVDLLGNKKILYSMAEEAPQGYYTLKVSISEDLGPIKAVGIDRYTATEAGITSWTDSAGKLVEIRVFGKEYDKGMIYCNTGGKYGAVTSAYNAMPGIENKIAKMTAKTNDSANVIDGNPDSQYVWDNGSYRGKDVDDKEWTSATPLELSGIVLYASSTPRAGYFPNCTDSISYFDIYVKDKDGNKHIVWSMDKAPVQEGNTRGYYVIDVKVDPSIPVTAVGIDRYTLDEAGVSSWTDTAGIIGELCVYGKDYKEYEVSCDGSVVTVNSKVDKDVYVSVVGYDTDDYSSLNDIQWLETSIVKGINTFPIDNVVKDDLYKRIFLFDRNLAPLVLDFTIE